VWGVGPPSPLPPGRARHLSSERRTHFVTRPSFAVSVTARSWQFIVSSTDDSWPLYMSPLLSSTVTTWPSASNKTLTGTDDDADADDDDAISAAHAAREARAEEAEDGTHGGAGKGGGGRVLLQAVGRVCGFLRLRDLCNSERARNPATSPPLRRPPARPVVPRVPSLPPAEGESPSPRRKAPGSTSSFPLPHSPPLLHTPLSPCSTLCTPSPGRTTPWSSPTTLAALRVRRTTRGRPPFRRRRVRSGRRRREGVSPPSSATASCCSRGAGTSSSSSRGTGRRMSCPVSLGLYASLSSCVRRPPPPHSPRPPTHPAVSSALPNLLAVIQAVCEERVTPSQMVSFHGKVIQCLHEAYPQVRVEGAAGTCDKNKMA
jgi:hypothetical protein